MALTLSGTNGVVGAGFTVDASGVSVTAGVGTFSSLNAAASGLTGALPAISGANLTNLPAANLTGTLPAISGANLTNVGITMADQWRITTGFSSSDQVLNSNWERHDTYGAGAVGSSLMTESSGVFSFPTTGIYYIHFACNAVYSGRSRYVGFTINTTTDNSSYGIITNAYDSLPNDTSAFSQMSAGALFDVTNTSTHKVYFQVFAEVSVTWEAHSDNNRTSAIFLRLGDT